MAYLNNANLNKVNLFLNKKIRLKDCLRILLDKYESTKEINASETSNAPDIIDE